MRNLQKFALAALALTLSVSCSHHFGTVIPGDTYHVYECTEYTRTADHVVKYRCLFVSDQNPAYTLAVFLPALPDTGSFTPDRILSGHLVTSK